jgi:hypothetical protein
MIKNGLYSLAAVSLDGVDAEVGGVLILRDGHITGGDSFVFYAGTYECSDGKWMGEMISQEHTPTTRPLAERVQRIEFSGTYDDAGAEADATAVIGKLRIRYDASLHTPFRVTALLLFEPVPLVTKGLDLRHHPPEQELSQLAAGMRLARRPDPTCDRQYRFFRGILWLPEVSVAILRGDFIDWLLLLNLYHPPIGALEHMVLQAIGLR